MKTAQEVLETVRSIRTCMLTTEEPNGQLRSRPMQVSEVDDMNFFWFFTRSTSGKVQEVDADPFVCLAFADPSTERYVSISGRAREMRDVEKMKELYNPMVKAWFPEGLDDPTLTLLRVEPERAEYWDSPGSKVVQAFQIAKAVVTGTEYSGGEMGEVAL